jgi:hypothetical protein
MVPCEWAAKMNGRLLLFPPAGLGLFGLGLGLGRRARKDSNAASTSDSASCMAASVAGLSGPLAPQLKPLPATWMAMDAWR